MANQQLNSVSKSLGIYVHVPFCRSKCAYCDFYSVARSGNTTDLMDRYVKALQQHITESGPRTTNYMVDTIYFGGGTPSYFGADRLRQVYQTITKKFNVSRSAEVTLEANPDSITEQACKRLLQTGFNRISIGIQNNNDALLRAIGRVHTYRQAVRSVNIARTAGFDNISIDLMYGLPSQTPQQWADTLGSIIDLRPDHISCYALTLHPGTPMYQYRGSAAFPNDDMQASMYLYAVSTLEAYGYHQYEISNFSKRDKESYHNLKYWMGGEYMGFGPSAASDFGGTRYTFKSDLQEYIRAITKGDVITSECESISQRERASEYIMLRLRTIYGIEKNEYERSFLLPFAPLERRLTFLAKNGFAAYDQKNRSWHLTPQGMFVSDAIIAQLQDEQARSTPLSPYFMH